VSQHRGAAPRLDSLSPATLITYTREGDSHERHAFIAHLADQVGSVAPQLRRGKAQAVRPHQL
jgi:hypothetical protein